MTSAPGAHTRSQLSILADVIVAPKAAFEALDARPRFIVAFIVVCILGMIGAAMQVSVREHVDIATLAHKAAHDPSVASMSPKQLDNIKSFTLLIEHYVWTIFPVFALIGITVAALFLLAGNAIGRGAGTFAKYFALAVHIAIVNFGIYSLLLGVLCITHSPDAFDTQSDILRLVPSLAWLVPSAGPKLTILLVEFNPFVLWSLVLLALGLKTVGRVSTPVAYVTAAVIAFGNLLLAVPFAK